MKTKINLSILLTGLIGISSFTAEAQNSRIWARISDTQSTPRVLDNGSIGSTNPSFANALNQIGVSEVHQALSNSKNEKLQSVYEFNCACDVATLENTLRNFPGVIAEIERAPEYKTLYVPNDYNAVFSTNYALDLIKAPQAWNQTQSNAGIIVGISDENLNPYHEELAGKITYYDYHNTLPSEHGTAVAIIAAGKTDNMVGVSSIGFNSSIAFYEMDFNQLLLATYAGIDVINVSWFSGCSFSQFEQDVIDEVYANGTFIVAAAGNGTTCGDPSALAFPASYNHVFSVTSIGEHDNHEENIGDPHTAHQHNSRVDLAAPGYKVNISDSPVNYTTASGSSYAAPFVTGTVALMLSVNPCIDNDEIEQILKASSVNIDALNPAYAGSIGAGRLNANAAVSMALATQSNMDAVTNVINACTEGNGSVTISPSNGQEPYQVNTSNGQSEFYFGDLTSGTYNYQITDAHGCVINTTATVNNGSPVIEEVTLTDVTCNGGSNGSINLTVNAGNPSYTFNWSNGLTTESNTTLGAGTYAVQITDANGCTTSGTYVINEPEAIEINPIVSADFGNNDGSIDLNVSGGTPGYSYEWSNGQTTEDVFGLTAGTYSVITTDANGCATSTFVEVANESTADLSSLGLIALNVYPNPTNADAKVQWKGNVTKVIVAEQTGRIVMAKPVTNFNSMLIQNLEAGLYIITVKGPNGLSATKQLVVL
ncbi:MAG: hypothetical protein RL365_84 [Bacteroidota bacterium]|jgi:hypothetical protein